MPNMGKPHPIQWSRRLHVQIGNAVKDSARTKQPTGVDPLLARPQTLAFFQGLFVNESVNRHRMFFWAPLKMLQMVSKNALTSSRASPPTRAVKIFLRKAQPRDAESNLSTIRGRKHADFLLLYSKCSEQSSYYTTYYTRTLEFLKIMMQHHSQKSGSFPVHLQISALRQPSRQN